MNRTIILLTIIGLLLGFLTDPPTASCQEKTRLMAPSMKGLEFRNAATHSQLTETLEASQKNKPMKKFKAKSLEEDPSKTSKSDDFIKHSDILCLNGSATFIPKQAILNLPDRFADRFKLKKDSKITTFPAFYAANRGWIMTYEVSIEQAFGKESFDKKKMKWLKGCGRVVVATFKNGPITVLPYVEESEKETEEKPEL